MASVTIVGQKMDVIKYVGKVVKVDLLNGFYYEGTVEKVDDDSLSLIDKFGKWVDISISKISLIREIR